MKNTRGAVSRKTAAETPARWSGQIEGLRDELLYGWACDMLRPDARVVVEVCLNGEPFGCVIADAARPELDFGAGDCCHGFVADLGMMVRQGEGTVTVRVANTATLLPGAVDLSRPEEVPQAAPTLVMSDGGLRLTGWALDTRDAGRTLRVAAYRAGQRVAETAADRMLPFMRGHVDAAHGFILDLPLWLADGRLHEVYIADEDGRTLAGSPLQVCVAGGAARALVEDDNSLLHDVLAMYERYVPRSLGLEHYEAWSDRFEPEQYEGDVATGGAVAVIVHGPAGRDVTVASLRRQLGVRCLIVETDGMAPSFAEAVRAALAGDVAYVACVRAGDTLPAHALARALEGFALAGAQIVYADSETALPGQRRTPWFKPAWNPEYALGSDYPLELMVARADLVRNTLVGEALLDNAPQLAWNALAAVWENGHDAIVHVPRVLYRFHSALSEAERAQRHAAATSALSMIEPEATLAPLPLSGPDFSARRLQRPHATAGVTVSLIIPTRDQVGLLTRCIDSLLAHTRRVGLEIIVVDNDSAQAETHAYFKEIAQHGVRVLPAPGPFNFSRINNEAVAAATGEVIGLINNDIEALHDGWLEEMLSHLLRPGVGAVGAKLLWPNGMVQHGGVLMGMGNVAGHYGNLLADGDAGDHGRNQLAQQMSGVTAACLLMRTADYLAIGGLDEVAFPVAFNDVDLCLRLRARGDAVVWTSWARLLHAESASRGAEDTSQKQARARRELTQLRKRWGHLLCADPAYHPSLNLDAHTQAYSGLALPPHSRAGRRAGGSFGKASYPCDE